MNVASTSTLPVIVPASAKAPSSPQPPADAEPATPVLALEGQEMLVYTSSAGKEVPVSVKGPLGARPWFGGDAVDGAISYARHKLHANAPFAAYGEEESIPGALVVEVEPGRNVAMVPDRPVPSDATRIEVTSPLLRAIIPGDVWHEWVVPAPL